MPLISGPHLGIVRRWIQTKAFNGSTVTWGTEEALELRCTITVGRMERLAQRIRNAVMAEVRQKLGVCNNYEHSGPMFERCSRCDQMKFFHEE